MFDGQERLSEYPKMSFQRSATVYEGRGSDLFANNPYGHVLANELVVNIMKMVHRTPLLNDCIS